LRQVVELEKSKVLTSLSAEEGLEIIANYKIDAIISDINLPGMTGVDLLELAKKKYPNIPVILMTGYSNRYTPKFAIETGADSFLNKPFKNVDLIRKLRRVIPGKFQRSCLRSE
jgi:YesN/AraC family two-component response regulator